ncbi:MAG: MMPL family transporter [Deinococcales bacterium]
MFLRLAHLISRYPKAILAFWLLIFILALALAARVNEVLNSEVDPPPGSVANQVSGIIKEHFNERNGFQVIMISRYLLELSSSPLVSTDTTPLLEPFTLAYAQEMTTIASWSEIQSLTDYLSQSTLPLRVDAMRAIAILNLNATSFAEAKSMAEALAMRLQQRPDWQHVLTGGAALENSIIHLGEKDARRAELYGLPFSLVILIIVFGSVVSASLPILIAILAIVISLASMFLLGQIFHFATYAQIVVSLVGLGTGIDYALLMVNRYREELRQHQDPEKASLYTTATAGRSVFSSGVTVMIALGSLLIPPSQFINSIGIGGMLVVFFSVLISITFLPALLRLLGPNVDRLRLSRREPGLRSHHFWGSWASLILKRPWLYASLGLFIILVLSLPALRMQLAFAGIRGIVAEDDFKPVEDILNDDRFASLMRSFDVLIDFEARGFFHPSSVRAMSKLSRSYATIEGIEQVLSPTTVSGLPALIVQQYYATQELALSSPLKDLVTTSISQNGRYVLVQVFPQSLNTSKERQELIQHLQGTAEALGLKVLVGGDYVGEEEWISAIYQSFPSALLFVYLITFILLTLTFRSLFIALKSIILNTLTVIAAFGVVTLVFQEGWLASVFALPQGLGFIESSVPLFIFAIVFGISMDYEVFLLARVYEAHKQGKSDKEAMHYALSRTGGVISSAALIMLAVFTAFFFSHIVFIKTLSLGLAVAVFLDATVIRLALVPAVMILAGKWNWWLPKPLVNLSKRLGLEHTEVSQEDKYEKLNTP